MLFREFFVGPAVAIIVFIAVILPLVAHASTMPDNYRKIEIIVEGEKDLSGFYSVDEKGVINMPLIGNVTIKGKTPDQTKNEITSRLKNGYIKNPQVLVKIAAAKTDFHLNKSNHVVEKKVDPPQYSAKGIYILGEVNTPGYYQLPKNASHLLNIVAMAGGYTDNANKKEFEIVRNIDGTYYRKAARVGALEYHDGDIIIINKTR